MIFELSSSTQLEVRKEQNKVAINNLICISFLKRGKYVIIRYDKRNKKPVGGIFQGLIFQEIIIST